MYSSDSSKRLILPVFDPSRGDKSVFEGSSMTRKGAFAAIAYMAAAVLLIIFNKAALSSYNFPNGNVITLCQIICSCTFLFLMRHLKIISFTVDEPSNESDSSGGLVPFKTLVQTLPIALSYMFYMVVSMESVRGVNVPMYTTLRRTAVVFTMALEYLLTRKKYSLSVLSCVALIVNGAFVAGARDLSFDSYSYSVVFMCNISSAIYVTTVAHYGKQSGLNSFGLIWCNGIISGPILLVWTFVRGDLQTTIEFPYLCTTAFQAVILLSCIMAFLLNYFSFLNTILNSALTQTICGNLKDFFTVIIGWLLFGGLPFDALNITGQCIGFIGACFYAYCKLKEK